MNSPAPSPALSEPFKRGWEAASMLAGGIEERRNPYIRDSWQWKEFAAGAKACDERFERFLAWIDAGCPD